MPPLHHVAGQARQVRRNRPDQRQRGVRRRLPTGAQGQHARLRRYADDADAVVGARRDDAGDAGAVRFGERRPAIDEVGSQSDLAEQVGMLLVDAAVDDGDTHAASGRDLVKLGQMPSARRRLHRIQRVVAASPLRLVDVHRLRPHHTAIARQRLCDGLGCSARRHGHHEAIGTEHRHRPRGDERQTVLARELCRDAAARVAARPVAIAAGVVAVGAKVLGRHLQQHQHLLLRVADGDRVGCVAARLVGGDCPRRGEPEQQGGDRVPHGCDPASSDSASTTALCVRSSVSAACWRPAGRPST